MAQGGDIVQLLANGVVTKDTIVADLFELMRETRRRRRRRKEGTLFQSVGTALVNLTAAVLAYQGLIQRQEIEARPKKS